MMINRPVLQIHLRALLTTAKVKLSRLKIPPRFQLKVKTRIVRQMILILQAAGQQKLFLQRLQKDVQFI
ncbi:hypothetical protein D5270_16340 [Acutalibacter sp. 1XD8-36]|nr:hypothetical protein [Acutalibacter sp. 1XD8-36]